MDGRHRLHGIHGQPVEIAASGRLAAASFFTSLHGQTSLHSQRNLETHAQASAAQTRGHILLTSCRHPDVETFATRRYILTGKRNSDARPEKA